MTYAIWTYHLFPAVGFVLVKKLYHIQSEEYSHGKEQKKAR